MRQRAEHLWQEIKRAGWQFLFTLNKHAEAVLFIKEHRLWSGMLRYGWLSKFLVVAGLILGLKMLSVLIDWWQNARFSEPEMALSSVGQLYENMAAEGYELFVAGSMKYVLLILLEVIIFHFSRRTVEILSGVPVNPGFKEFIRAQKRMIAIVFYCYAMEIVVTVLIKVFFGIFGFVSFLQPAFIFLAHAFFLGYAVMDNYIEQFHLKIKESIRYSRQFIGVGICTGLILHLLLPIPVAGPVLGSVLAAVAATLAMWELSDLHLRGQEEAVEGQQSLPAEAGWSEEGTAG